MSKVKLSKQMLKQRQSLPLDIKVEMTKRRIREFYEYFGGDVYLAYSGGKDSSVLYNIIDDMHKRYHDIPRIFVDTGLEFPELKQSIYDKINNKDCYREFDSIDGKYYYKHKVGIVKAEKTFRQVLEDYGYPIISKEVSRGIKDLQNPTPNNENTRRTRLFGVRADGSKTNAGKLADKWIEKFFDVKKVSEDEIEEEDYPIEYQGDYYIVEPKIDFDVSYYCCNYMKKRPFKKYNKETGRKPIIGVMASESNMRERKYMLRGTCNTYDTNQPQSKPISFWTEQDVLKYIYENDVQIPSVYGEVVEDAGEYKTTGEQRTGCIYCAFGVNQEEEPNRFQRLKETHPKLWKYCMDDLGLREVLEFLDIPYK